MRVPLKAVLRELDRRGDVRFADVRREVQALDRELTRVIPGLTKGWDFLRKYRNFIKRYRPNLKNYSKLCNELKDFLEAHTMSYKNKAIEEILEYDGFWDDRK